MHQSFSKLENIVGKGENAGYQHFLLFQQCFQMAALSGSLKGGIVCQMVHNIHILSSITLTLHVSQCIMGMGVPQYLCLDISQSFNN